MTSLQDSNALKSSYGYASFITGALFLFSGLLAAGSSIHAFIIPFWLPAGVALAGLLHFGKACLPGLILGIFITNLTLATKLSGITSNDILASSLITFGAIFQAIVAARLLTFFNAKPFSPKHEGALLHYILWAGIFTCLINAVIGTSSVNLSSHPEISGGWFSDFVIWWIGDSFGAICFTPLVLQLFQRLEGKRPFDGILMGKFLTIIVASYLVNYLYLSHIEKQFKTNFNQEIKVLNAQLQAMVQHNHADLARLERVTIAEGGMPAELFESYANELISKNPAVLAYSWDPIIWPEQRKAFEEETRQTLKDPTYKIFGESIGGADQPTIPVQWVEPRAKNSAALGFNLLSLDNRRDSVLEAIRNGRAITTEILRLQQAPDEPGFLILQPVYIAQNNQPNQLKGEKQLVGFMVGVFTVTRMINAAFHEASLQHINLSLYEEGSETPFLEMGESHAGLLFEGSMVIEIGQRRWRLELSANKKWLSHNPNIEVLSIQVLLVLISIMAVFSVLSSHNREEIMRARITTQTKTLSYTARHDLLTSLPNRLSLEEQISDHIKNYPATEFYLFFLDLDRFKLINDSLGHPTGDLLLKALAKLMNQEAADNEATLFRMGGDEFILFIETNQKEALQLADQLLSLCRLPIEVEMIHLQVTISIGISCYPKDGLNLETLIKHADTAMYQAKAQGKNRYSLYSEEYTDITLRSFSLEQDMRSALLEKQFILHFQPQYQVDGKQLCGVEALVRWQHPQNGLIPPNHFIPIAEETLLIIELGWLVINLCCEQILKWREKQIYIPYVAINISPKQLLQSDFVEQLINLIDKHQINHSQIELEITESALMQDPDYAFQQLEKLKNAGFRLALDDFGTGYSSFNRLKRLPIDRLKIDQSFTRDIGQSNRDEAIILSIIALGHSLGMDVLAEGVETEQQRVFLDKAGCNSLQGYLLCRPQQADHLPF